MERPRTLSTVVKPESKPTQMQGVFTGRVWEPEDSCLLSIRDCVFMLTDVYPELGQRGFDLTRERPSMCFLTSISRASFDECRVAYESALETCWNSPEDLLTQHADAWLDIWRTGRMLLHTTRPVCFEDTEQSSSWEVVFASDSDELSSCNLPKVEDAKCVKFSVSRCLLASQYAILSNFPEPKGRALQPLGLPMPVLATGAASLQSPLLCSFFGVSPCGLAWGNTEDDYQGHVFWDMETWILPWLTLFQPAMTKLAFEYRWMTLGVAEARATAEGLRGARYPWESARTGTETSPWELSANKELHVIADISFALQQWLICSCSTTEADTIGGLMAYNKFGRQIMDSIARFWTSRISYSGEKEAYVILDVMPPDEYVHSCDNSAFTNAAVSQALSGPAKLARLFGSEVSAEQRQWEQMSSRIWMPFDEANQVMLEFEGYENGKIKQADTILLSYPLMYPQTQEAKENMIKRYAGATTLSGPAMTWSMFCIDALEIGVWTEERDQQGAKNFLTGAGGFLQSVVNGYTGLRVCLPRLHKDEVNVTPALFLNPQTSVPIPCDCTENQINKSNALSLLGVAFLGRCLDFVFDFFNRKTTVTLQSGSPLTVTQLRKNLFSPDGPIDPNPQKSLLLNGTLHFPFSAFWLHQ